MDSGNLKAVDYPTGTDTVTQPISADLDLNGIPETIVMDEANLLIYSGDRIVWSSPSEWEVVDSAFTDLNHDNQTEVALLVWRPFQPWPVDRFLLHGGRIQSFHDGNNSSCHIILIGWNRKGYTELWAGSALAEPVTAFIAADLDIDGRQELITLEGRYSRSGSTPAMTLKVWTWNGFGFSAVTHVKGKYSTLALSSEASGRILILTP